jgi:hypothetical protein
VYGTRAVKVQLTNGRTDYIVSSMNPEGAFIIDGKVRFQGSFGVYSEKDDLPVFTYTNDGAYIGKVGTSYASAGVGRLQGTIVDFTRELSLTNKLKVQLDLQGQAPNDLIGKSVFVQNDGKRNAVYLIRGVQSLGGNAYEFDLGDITLVRAYASATDLNQGFVYDVAPGSAFVIPLPRQQLYLSDVTIVSPKTELDKNETANLQVKGTYADGTHADLTGYNFIWESVHPNIADVNEQNRLKAHNTGTTSISTMVNVGGIQRKGSLQITVK